MSSRVSVFSRSVAQRLGGETDRQLGVQVQKAHDHLTEWSRRDLHARPRRCERRALLAELRPQHFPQPILLPCSAPLKDFRHANAIRIERVNSYALGRISYFGMGERCCGNATIESAAVYVQRSPAWGIGNSERGVRGRLKCGPQVFDSGVCVAFEHADIRVAQTLGHGNVRNSRRNHARRNAVSVTIQRDVFGQSSLPADSLPLLTQCVADLPRCSVLCREDKLAIWSPSLSSVEYRGDGVGNNDVARLASSTLALVLGHADELVVDPGPFERDKLVGADASQPEELQHVGEVRIDARGDGAIVLVRGNRSAVAVRGECHALERVAINFPKLRRTTEGGSDSSGAALSRSWGLPGLSCDHPIFQVERLGLTDTQVSQVFGEGKLNRLFRTERGFGQLGDSLGEIPVDHVGYGERGGSLGVAVLGDERGTETVGRKRLPLIGAGRRDSRTGIGSRSRRHELTPFRNATSEGSYSCRACSVAPVQARPEAIINTSYKSQKQVFRISECGTYRQTAEVSTLGKVRNFRSFSSIRGRGFGSKPRIRHVSKVAESAEDSLRLGALSAPVPSGARNVAGCCPTDGTRWRWRVE